MVGFLVYFIHVCIVEHDGEVIHHYFFPDWEALTYPPRQPPLNIS